MKQDFKIRDTLFELTQILSLFHMKITASVAKSSHQDRGLRYLHLPIFSYTHALLFCWKIKSCCHRCFPQQIRLQITVQLYILQDYSSVRIGFNMINKRHTLPIKHHINLNSLSFHHSFIQSYMKTFFQTLFYKP